MYCFSLMPVCPGRVNGFSLLLLEKPFTLPGYTGHRRSWCPYVILYRRLFQPGYTGHIHFIRDSRSIQKNELYKILFSAYSNERRKCVIRSLNRKPTRRRRVRVERHARSSRPASIVARHRLHLPKRNCFTSVRLRTPKQ